MKLYKYTDGRANASGQKIKERREAAGLSQEELSFLISLIFIVCHLQNTPLLACLHNTPLSAHCQAPFRIFRKEKGRFPVLIHQQAAARKFARLAPSRSRAARSLARRARRFRSGLLLFGSGSTRL